MYSVVVAFGLASVMLCIGMAIRAKVKFFQHMLMPVSVIGGILGFILMNLVLSKYPVGGVSVTDFSNIVDVFFVMSFISIGLTGSKKKKNKKTEDGKKKKSSGPVRGAIGMALIWCILYALQPLVGILIVSITGKAFHMDSMYGILVPFAFCQGPGQASTYGRLFEYTYGFDKAEMVALTYAIFGFLSAFLIGVPFARYGLKKGLARNKSKINEAVERGYFVPEEQREPLGKSTFHSANIETAVMRKLNIEYLINNAFQSRITGFLSDYLVVCAFMAIQVGIIGNWIVPILLASVASGIVTFFICLFFGERLGSDHDFERVLGVFGTSTGTTPSGVSLLRMVDPKLQTSTGAELGMMNMAMIFSTPTMLFITFAGLKMISLPIACGGMFLTIFIYIILLKVFGVLRKPNFTVAKGRISDGAESGEEIPFLRGYLHDTVDVTDTAAVESMIHNSWN